MAPKADSFQPEPLWSEHPATHSCSQGQGQEKEEFWRRKNQTNQDSEAKYRLN